MYLGRVIGTVVATSKNTHLVGTKLLIVEKLTEHLKREGTTEIAVDSVGAGSGEIVIVCRGTSARAVFENQGGEHAPIDASIVGIVDTVEVSGGLEED